MKKILFAIVALFTFVVFQANSQQINFTIGSANGAFGTVVNIPVEVSFPSGSQQVNGLDCTLELSDPSKAQIIGFTSNPLITGNIVSGSFFNFATTSANPAPQLEGVVVTLQVQIMGLGCTDISLTDSPVSQFVVDGVVYDDFNTDYNLTNGQVCGIADCIMPPFDLECNLTIDKDGHHQTLSWLPVLTAVSYEIEFSFNDPSCCPGVSGNKYTIIASAGSTPSFDVPSHYRCFLWKVRATCADGSTSIWSRNSCSCGPVSPGGPGPGFMSPVGITEFLDVKTVPNPANNFVEVSLTGLQDDVELNASEVVIYSVSGKEVYRSTIALNETKRIDLSSFESGIYFLNVLENGVILSNEKLIVE
jgi:hypothetical protein